MSNIVDSQLPLIYVTELRLEDFFSYYTKYLAALPKELGKEIKYSKKRKASTTDEEDTEQHKKAKAPLAPYPYLTGECKSFPVMKYKCPLDMPLSPNQRQEHSYSKVNFLSSPFDVQIIAKSDVRSIITYEVILKFSQMGIKDLHPSQPLTSKSLEAINSSCDD